MDTVASAILTSASSFEPGENGAGQGLKNMKLRAASIGGELDLAAAPGGGTTLEVVLRA